MRDIFADGIRQNQFTPETVTLIKFSSEPGKLTHDLDEIALSFGISVLDLLFLV